MTCMKCGKDFGETATDYFNHRCTPLSRVFFYTNPSDRDWIGDMMLKELFLIKRPPLVINGIDFNERLDHEKELLHARLYLREQWRKINGIIQRIWNFTQANAVPETLFNIGTWNGRRLAETPLHHHPTSSIKFSLKILSTYAHFFCKKWSQSIKKL